MNNTLYNEAIEAAEQIKLAAEEKVKQQIVESISPKIKSLVEKKLFESSNYQEEYDIESLDEDEECGYESLDEDEAEGQEDSDLASSEDKDEETVQLNKESRRILNKLISSNAKKDAAYQKIQELSESIGSLQKAIILSENSKQYTSTKSRVVVLYKNLISEISKLKTNSIIRSDRELLKEFYKLNKELENMSRRHSNRKYLNESLEDLLEMDLFEAEEDDDDMDLEDGDEMPEDGDEMPEDDDMDLDMPEDEDDEEDESDSSAIELDDLRSMSVGELGALVAGESDKMSDEEEDEEEPELDLEGLFESEDDALEEEDEMETLRAGDMQESRRRNRVLEIDENMLRREIGRMKSLREGEAKDMAHHFGGGSIEGEVFVDGVELNKLHEMKIKAAKAIRKNRMLESKLTQHKKALRIMKNQLTEMNLFNAKLLYANKLMQNRDLTMNQQRHIVESLDEAKTLGEAKILFESLSKSLVSNRKTSNNNLTEGATRRPLSSSSQPVRSAQSKPMNESVALDRWATLAGIK